MNTATTASKRVIQKTAEVAGDLIGNKMAKSKKKKENERQEIYIPAKKWQQIIDDLRLF